MKLQTLKLHNFKGLRDYELKPLGEDLVIKGDNGTGKTTVMDGVTWLLFNKDSQNRTNFEIKTIGTDGVTLHKLDHEVEAVFQIDTQPNTPPTDIKLRKVYREKYTKKKGTALAEFTGHDTDYYINDVPAKAKEYQDYISTLIDEDLFRMLTNPKYFNEHISWQKRREILLDICGDVSDEDVIASDDRLEDIGIMLEGQTMANYEKIAKDKRAAISKDLKEIPWRIDEDTRLLVDAGDIDSIQAEVDAIGEERQEKQAEIDNVVSGGALALKKAEHQNLVNASRGLDNDIRQQITDLDIQAQKLRGSIMAYEQTIAGNKTSIDNKETRKADFTKKWHEVNNRTHNASTEAICPTCAQPIPEAKIAEANAEALKQFNEEKASMKKIIEADGFACKDAINVLTRENIDLEERIAGNRDELEVIEADIKALEDQPAPDGGETKAKIEALEGEIKLLEDESQDIFDRLKDELTVIIGKREEAEQRLAEAKQSEGIKERINKLREKEKTLATEFEAIEKQLYMIELFEKAKVDLLEDKINSQFTLARFKLFKQNINGGTEPCCETMVNGVPYSGGLNNGMQIAVGIDIINRLEAYYNATAPIFIDNAEAITDIPATEAQQIRMYVSADDKKLRVLA